MRSVIVVLSDFTRCSPLSADVDYWVMQGVLDEGEVEAHRSEGVAITVFNAIPDDDDAILLMAATATLHNSDWRELNVFR